jgi:hypothetical protein
MTTTRLVRARPRVSPAWLGAAALIALVAATAGWLISDRIAADPPPAPRAAAADHVLRAGPVGLRVSALWTPTRRPPAVPGLAGAPAWNPYVGVTTTVSAALLPARDATLLPPALTHSGTLPTPDTARIGGVLARAYRGLRTGGAVLDVYAVPTTRGIVTLACRTGDASAEAPAWCLNGLEQVAVANGRPLRPTPDTAYRLGAPAILRPLDRARVRERRSLRAARHYTGQARVAQALSADYAGAARRLAPLAPATGAAAAVPGALRSAAAAYHGLARAARHRDRKAWRRYRGVVGRAEATVKRRVAAVG